MNKKRFLFFLPVIMIILLCCDCQPISSTGTPSVTEIPLPTFEPRATPISDQDYDIGPDFDCWRASSDPTSLVNQSDVLLVSIASTDRAKTNHKNGTYLVDLANQTYTLITNETTSPVEFGEPTSPMRNAIGYDTVRLANDYHIYDVKNNLFRDMPNIPEHNRQSTRWSPDGQCALLEKNKAIVAYRISDGKLQKKTIPGYEMRWYFDVSPDGEWWVRGGEKGIVVVNLEGEPLNNPSFETPFPASLGVWSPDGKYLAIAYYNKKDYAPKEFRPQYIRVVDLETNGGYQDIFLTEDFVTEIQWTNDSSRLLVKSFASDVMIYDLSQNRIFIKNFNRFLYDNFPEQHSLDQYCFSNDGKKLYFSSYTYKKGSRIDDRKKIYVYDFYSGALTQIPLPTEFDNQSWISIDGLYCVTKSSP